MIVPADPRVYHRAEAGLRWLVDPLLRPYDVSICTVRVKGGGVQLRELYVIDMYYTYDTLLAEPGTDGKGPGGQFYGELSGSVSGQVLSGSFRASNRARRRMDGAFMPDFHGMILTDDGAEIYVIHQGYGLPEPVGRRTIVGGGFHQTDDERYGWLNSVYVVFEGAVIAGGQAPDNALLRLRVFECMPQPHDL